MWRLFFVAGVFGCSPITPIRVDGGVDAGIGGGSAGGSVVAGGSAGGIAGGQAGGMAGGQAGGQAGGASGGTAGGVSVPFTWSAIGVPANTGIQAVSGRPGELYAVSFNRELLRITGNVLALVPGFDLADIGDVYVSPSGRVIVTSTRNASRVCASACENGSNYSQRLSQIATDRFGSMCGRGEDVYAIAYGTSLGGILYRFVNDQWTRAMTDVGVGSAYGCEVLPDGTVLVVGLNGVARFDGVANAEPITLNGQAPQWRAIALGERDGGAGEAIIVGGFGAYRSALRSAGSWNVLPPVTTGRELEQVAAYGADEFVALGDPMSGGPVLMHYREGTWAPLTGAPTNLSSFSLLTSANGALFLGGIRSNASVLFRGTRP
jgi:hypothetical protein